MFVKRQTRAPWEATIFESETDGSRRDQEWAVDVLSPLFDAVQGPGEGPATRRSGVDGN